MNYWVVAALTPNGYQLYSERDDYLRSESEAIDLALKLNIDQQTDAWFPMRWHRYYEVSRAFS